MIENGFITTRAVVMRSDATTLKTGLLHYLFELEEEYNQFLRDHEEMGCEDVEQVVFDPWEIADSLFQYLVFTERRTSTRGEDEVDSEPEEVVETLSEAEIEKEIQKFKDILGGKGEVENE